MSAPAPLNGEGPWTHVSDEVFALLTERWVLLILMTLGRQPLRFSGLRRAIPRLSANVLTVRLRQLEVVHLVARQSASTAAPHRLYHLGPAAQGLRPALDQLERWKAGLVSEDRVCHCSSRSTLDG